MTCARYHYTSLGFERWAFSWNQLTGGDDLEATFALYCLALLLGTFGNHRQRAQA
jgi:hypothetical protein